MDQQQRVCRLAMAYGPSFWRHKSRALIEKSDEWEGRRLVWNVGTRAVLDFESPAGHLVAFF